MEQVLTDGVISRITFVRPLMFNLRFHSKMWEKGRLNEVVSYYNVQNSSLFHSRYLQDCGIFQTLGLIYLNLEHHC